MRMRALKICLWIAGILCLLSVFGIFLPISAWQSFAKIFGIESLPDSPVFVYAARLMSATYALVGVFFIILALDPMKYGVLVLFSGVASVLLGVVCAIVGLIAKMPNLWFLCDSSSCVVLGVLILAFWQRAKQKAVV
jgi:hypothetical protein